jgi:hypothetical protein
VILGTTMCHDILRCLFFLSWPWDEALDNATVSPILQQGGGEIQCNFILKWVSTPMGSDSDMHLLEYNFLDFSIDSSLVSLEFVVLMTASRRWMCISWWDFFLEEDPFEHLSWEDLGTLRPWDVAHSPRR